MMMFLCLLGTVSATTELFVPEPTPEPTRSPTIGVAIGLPGVVGCPAGTNPITSAEQCEDTAPLYKDGSTPYDPSWAAQGKCKPGSKLCKTTETRDGRVCVFKGGVYPQIIAFTDRLGNKATLLCSTQTSAPVPAPTPSPTMHACHYHHEDRASCEAETGYAPGCLYKRMKPGQSEGGFTNDRSKNIFRCIAFDCGMLPKKGQCKRRNGCFWDKAKTPSCQYTKVVKKCSDMTKKSKCKKLAECGWDVNQNICVVGDVQKKCATSNGIKGQCLKMDYCYWRASDSTCQDGTAPEKTCSGQMNEPKCKKFGKTAANGCYWDSADTTCKDGSKPVNCADYTKGKCDKSDTCEWDKTICVLAGAVGPTICADLTALGKGKCNKQTGCLWTSDACVDEGSADLCAGKPQKKCGQPRNDCVYNSVTEACYDPSG